MASLTARRLRLASGLVLLTYLATHLANHALGLVSLETMERGREWFLAFWRHPLASVALYSALVLHGLLALRSLYRRRHFRMPAWETAQLTLGLAIPPLLAAHVVGTRLAATLFGVTDSYTRVVLALWQPANGTRQVILITIAWLHGCIGLHFWLRLQPWYRHVTGVLFAVALVLPILALLGFESAGREVSEHARDPRWVAALARTTHAPDPAGAARLERARDRILGAYGGALVLVFVARGVRRLRQRSHSVRITYPDAREVIVPLGFTVLEASRFARIPHASVCGGRGRCSTCRVRVLKGLGDAPPASVAELRVLERVGAPPDVRLACQLRPAHDVSVAPVLPSTAGPADAVLRVDHRGGREQELAVLFADLRGFTRIAEDKLPYDVVFILNRYFQAVGGAITRAGGVPNQFTGDGVMALFGVDGDTASACRQALAASRGIVESLGALNRDLADELRAPLRIGIGIHVGPVIVGRMGYGEGVYLTAVGDTVHVASRLEQLTKEYGCSLVFSEEVAKHAAIDASRFRRHELTVRNRAGLLAIRVVDDVHRLPLGAGT